MRGLIFLFLLLSLLTGGLSFGGFLAGSSILILFKVLFPICVILLVASLVKHLFFPPTP
ncbi:MAG: hypothetical protein P4L22_02470 [Candidatus Babeliales bacterium]|nr:hypothetical protein [Candidatus Babeliales bacterium]